MTSFMCSPRENLRPLDASGVLSWVHFGDLHLTGKHAQNHQDFLALIAEANVHLAGLEGVNFAVLPGDNADAGTEAQYLPVRRALDGLQMPVHALPGDHDIQGGNLGLFRRWLEPVLPRSFVAGDYRCVFLNAVEIEGTKGFGLGRHQLAWLGGELEAAEKAGQKAALFLHTYPSKLGSDAREATALTRRHRRSVRLVEMGHTHYNEIANDGHVIYAATRSTGQIEKGPVGFSLTCLDGDAVSWKFKALGGPWPLVMITSPADRAFRASAPGPTRGRVEVRARAWNALGDIARVVCQVDGGEWQPMPPLTGSAAWKWGWDSSTVPDGAHRRTVRAESAAGEDTIDVWCDQEGRHDLPVRSAIDSENAIGAYPSKGLLGTQLGPNKNGHGWEPPKPRAPSDAFPP